MRFQHLLYVVSLGFCLISVSACTSFQSERGEKRPTGREVAEEAGEATDAADRDDLVLYSTSIEDEPVDDEPADAEPETAPADEADDEPADEQPVDAEPADDEDVDEQEPATDEDVDEQEPADDDPSGEPAGDPAQE